jgi:hypothetical protein
VSLTACHSSSLRHSHVHLATMSQAFRVVRPTSLARRFTQPSSSNLRAICTTAPRLSGPKPPSLFGPGIKPGQVPTDLDQATGLERLQLLGEMEGVAVFDKTPLDSSRLGTMKDPVLVPSLVCRVVDLSEALYLHHLCFNRMYSAL